MALLDEEWLRDQTEFSLYFLRAIGQSLASRDDRAPPWRLLREVVDREISAMREEVGPLLGGDPRSPSAILAAVRVLVEQGKPLEAVLAELGRQQPTIDLVQFLGTLCWVSRFDTQSELMDPPRIVKWSSGQVPTTEAAKQLMDAGVRAKVFSEADLGVTWQGNLIGDVCAAVCFGNEVVSPNPSRERELLVIGMAERISDMNSLDVLRLALDTPVLVRFAELICRTKPASAHIVNDLLNIHLLGRLKSKPQHADRIIHALCVAAANCLGEEDASPGTVDFTHVRPIAFALAKLSDLSPAFQQLCCERVQAGRADPQAMVASATWAARHLDDNSFFAGVEEVGGSWEVALKAAGGMWGPAGGSILYQQLTAHERDAGLPVVVAIWSHWCARQVADALLPHAESIIGRAATDGRQDVLHARLLDETLRAAVAAGLRGGKDWFTGLLGMVPRAFRAGSPATASTILNRVVSFLGIRLADRTTLWAIDDVGKAAIPQSWCEPALAKEILHRIYEHSSLKLPSWGELYLLACRSQGEWELVRDGLSAAFRPSDPIVPSQLVTWNGQGRGFITRMELESTKVRWRPLISFEAAPK